MKTPNRRPKTVKEIKTVLIGADIPWSQLWVTQNCKKRCKYCTSYKISSEDPSFDKVVERITKLSILNVGFISLFGGEPTNRHDLPELVKVVNDFGIISHVTTNGSINEAYLQRLGENGIDILQLAPDFYGIDKPRVDRTKKTLTPSMLEMFLQGRDKFHYSLTFNICATKENFTEEHIGKLLDLAKKYQISTVIRPATPDKVPLDSTHVDKSVFLDLDEIREFTAHCSDKKDKGYPISTTYPYFEAVRDYANGTPQTWRCTSAEYFLVIDIKGNIIPCSEIQQPTQLNIDDLALDSINKSDLDQARRYIKKYVLPKCNPWCIQITPYNTSKGKEMLAQATTLGQKMKVIEQAIRDYVPPK